MQARILATAAAILFLAGTARGAASTRISADGLVLVVNKQQPAGRALAERYAELRHVPAGRIIEVDVPDRTEIAAEFYEKSIADVVRREIDARQLRPSTQCIVLFHGVPLRVREREQTPQDRAEVANVLDPMIASLRPRMLEAVQKVEAIARETASTTTPPATDAMPTAELQTRGAAAERAIEGALPKMPAASQADVRARLVAARAGLTQMPPLPGLPPKPATMPTQQQVAAWIVDADSRDARRQVREAFYHGSNLFQLLMLAEAQKRALVGGEGEASVDSELSCLWLPSYPRSRWVPNVWHAATPAATDRSQMVRVARIDGPTAQIARRAFEESIAAEQRGLRGDVVLDARGLSGSGAPGSYDACDQSIRNVAKFLGGLADLNTVFDNNPPLLPDNSSGKAALYCGWYSVRKYAPTVKLLSGAVAWHVASYEMVELRSPNERGWCRNLMIDGASVTIGPVGEPYLIAFPPADEFLGLLLTGRASVAEAYWAAVPITSWKMVLIGDPLYRPFAANPQVKPETLSPTLQRALPSD